MTKLPIVSRHRISSPVTQTSKARDIKDKNLSLTCKSLQSRFRLTRYEDNNALLPVLAAPCPCRSFIAADVSLVCSYSQMWYNWHQHQLPSLKQSRSFSTLNVLQDAAMQEKLAAQKEAAQRRAKVAEVERQRKQQTSLLRKKTKSGQPVMKHRIDKLLETLQQ